MIATYKNSYGHFEY